MPKKKYDIVIKAGEYQNNQGETKGRWVNLGAVMQGDDGGFFALLDPGVNLAAYKVEGKDRVIASLFDVERNNSGQQQHQQQRQQQNSATQSAPAPGGNMDDFDDDSGIPF